MDHTPKEHFLPELQSIQSDVEYLKHLRKRLWDVEHRISQAVEAIPALEKEIHEEEEARNVSSAALATLLSTSERVSALATVGPRNQFVESHLAPATAARSSASSTLAELIAYHAAIPGKLDGLRASLETARGVVHAGDAAHARLQAILHATVAAIKAKYELVHPVHRLPRALLSRVFALVVSEEYAAAAATVTSGKEARPLVSPTRLSLVCYLWRDIAHAAESLWNRILITASSHPAPFRTIDTEKPAFVLAVDGNGSPPGGDGGSRIIRQIESVASRTSLRELTYSGVAFEWVRECMAIIPHLKRLSLTYARSKSDPVVITLPAAPEGLSYLSCTHAYPSFGSTLAALETLAISVRSGGPEKCPALDHLLAKAPNLKTLLLSRTPDLVVENSIEHSSLTSIKAHLSAFRHLQNALLEGRLFAPNLSSLELHNISRDGFLSKWRDPRGWTARIVHLRLVFASRGAWSEGPGGVHKMLAPFPSLESLSIVREDRPELLLAAVSRRAGVSKLTKLTHIKVENSACYGVALLNRIKEYNEREEVLSGQVSRLTDVELFNCPNVAVGVMTQLRMLRMLKDVEQERKREEPGPSPGVPRAPSLPPLVVPEGVLQAAQPVEAEGHALDEKTLLRAVPVQDDATTTTDAASDAAPVATPQVPDPDEVQRPEGVALEPKEMPAKGSPLPLPPLLQRPQSERPLAPPRRQQWSGLCL